MKFYNLGDQSFETDVSTNSLADVTGIYGFNIPEAEQ